MTGADVKAIRSQLGLSQSELANQLNFIDSNLRVHATSVSRWESGKLNPSAHAAAAIGVLARGGQSPDDAPEITIADLTCPGCGQVGFFWEWGDLRYGRPIHFPGDDPATRPELGEIVSYSRMRATNIECRGCAHRLSDDHADRIWAALHSPEPVLLDDGRAV